MAPVVRIAFASIVLMGALAGALSHAVPPRPAIGAGAEPPGGTAGAWSNGPPLPPPGPSNHPYAGPAQPVVLGRDGSGQFHLSGQLNGHAVSFLVDTGADLVSIPAEQAEEMGLTVNESDYRPALQTASGSAMGAFVRIDKLEIAGVELHDVDAVVVRGLGTTLLGQSALRRLGKVELSGDSMVITPA